MIEGHYKEAQPLLQRALVIQEKTLGREHLDVAKILYRLALLHSVQDQYTEAEALFDRTLTIRERALGAEHPDVLLNREMLALFYTRNGRYDKAEALWHRILEIQEKALGRKHPKVATALSELASIHAYQGRYETAESLFRRARVIQEKTLGRNHPDVATILNSLASLKSAQGRYGEAETLLQEALTIQEHALGAEHPDTAQSQSRLAALYAAQHRYDLPVLRALSILTDENDLVFLDDTGAERPDAPQIIKGALAAVVNTAQENLAKGESQIEGLQVEQERVLGAEHPSLAPTINKLAGVHALQGQYLKAEPLYLRALAIQEQALGPEHPEVAWTLSRVSAIYEALGSPTKALAYAQRATAIHRNRLIPLIDDLSEGGLHERLSLHAQFIQHVRAISRVMEEQPEDSRQALIREAFEVGQLSRSPSTAATLTQMEVRSAVKEPELSRLVHSHQDVINQWQALNAMRLKRLMDGEPADERFDASGPALSNRIASLEGRIQALKTRVIREYPAYAELNDPQPATLVETQQLLAPDEALLVYLIGDKESYLWVVRRTQSTMQRLPVTSAALTQAVTKLRKALNKDAIKPFNLKLAHHLYSQLVAPASPFLEGVRHILVKADGALQSLPFAILITSPPKTSFVFPKRYPQQHWLGKQYAFTTLPAVSSLKMLRGIAHSSAAGKPFLGFGAPVLQGQTG